MSAVESATPPQNRLTAAYHPLRRQVAGACVQSAFAPLLSQLLGRAFGEPAASSTIRPPRRSGLTALRLLRTVNSR